MTTILITGASSGIGAEFAKALAANDVRMILVARTKSKLEEVASSIRNQTGDCLILPINLAEAGGVAKLTKALEDRKIEVDMLINNAGFGTYGKFGEVDGPRQIEEINLNVTALVELTHAVLPSMVRKAKGTIINVASTAGFQPLPFMAVYGATKAFVISFSEALAEEYEKAGIYVQVLCPGNTETPFHDHVGSTNNRVGSARTTQQVVRSSLRGIANKKWTVIDGFANAVLAQTPRFVSRKMTVKIASKIMGPK